MAAYVWSIAAINHAAQTLAHVTTEYWGYLTTDHDKFCRRLLTHGMHSGWSHFRAVHKLKIQLMIWLWSLVHACVAIVAAQNDSIQSQTLLLLMVCVPWHKSAHGLSWTNVEARISTSILPLQSYRSKWCYEINYTHWTVCNHNYKASILAQTQGFGLATPDPFFSCEQALGWDLGNGEGSYLNGQNVMNFLTKSCMSAYEWQWRTMSTCIILTVNLLPK